MQQKEDCFFYTDESLVPEKRKICTMCVRCREQHPELGWFWEGSKLGYGPFDFICKKCGHIIFTPRGQNEEAVVSG